MILNKSFHWKEKYLLLLLDMMHHQIHPNKNKSKHPKLLQLLVSKCIYL